MVRSKRNIDEVDTYESDGGFVSNDDGKTVPSKKSKKAKTNFESKGTKPKFWSLSTGRQPRRIEISDFKGTKLVNIREFYEKDDEYLPGKKGISLSIDQYQALLKAIPEINKGLKDVGIDVSSTAVDDDDDEVEEKPQRKAKNKQSKANIEATSDEEEEEDED